MAKYQNDLNTGTVWCNTRAKGIGGAAKCRTHIDIFTPMDILGVLCGFGPPGLTRRIFAEENCIRGHGALQHAGG